MELQQSNYQYNKNLSWKNGIPDYTLQTLTEEQRDILKWIIYVILVISVLGNIATIIVNSKRKMRPFFRILLFSLAGSDLITTVFSSTSYISQISDKFVQIWHLGDVLCACLPFMTTAALLINSMTLVGIAFDRYMAVMKVISGVNWEPGLLCCFAFVILVWGMSAGLASPMLMAYSTREVLLIITNPKNRSEPVEARRIEMCISDKALNSFYFVIIFSVVFIPMVVTFIWLNSVIAMEIWNRRKFNKSIQNNITTAANKTTAASRAAAVLPAKARKITKTTSSKIPSQPVVVKSLKIIPTLDNIFKDHYSQTNQNSIQNSIASNSTENLETPSTLKTTLEKDADNNDTESQDVLPTNCYKIIDSVNIVQPQQISSTSSLVTQPPTQTENISKIIVKQQEQQQQQQQQPQQQQSCQQHLKTKNPSSKRFGNYPHHRRREARQLRLFILIILLITIFLICRLPTWIFLLIRLYSVCNQSIHWILHYSFGILSLMSCLLNPYCYTFMIDTTRFTFTITNLCRRYLRNFANILSKPFILFWNWTLIKCSCKRIEFSKNGGTFPTNNLLNKKNSSLKIFLNEIETEKGKISSKNNDGDDDNDYVIVKSFSDDGTSRSYRNILKRNRGKSYDCKNKCDQNDDFGCDNNNNGDCKEIYTIFQEK